MKNEKTALEHAAEAIARAARAQRKNAPPEAPSWAWRILAETIADAEGATFVDDDDPQTAADRAEFAKAADWLFRLVDEARHGAVQRENREIDEATRKAARS